MQGALSLACLNRSRTREAPTPTNISTKSLPEMLKKGTSASPAMALASRVLPQPGSPTSSTPRGIRPPSRWKRLGFFRNSMISVHSSLASSMPATSLKVMLVCSFELTRCRERPKLPSMPPEPAPNPRNWRKTKNQMKAKTRIQGTMFSKTLRKTPLLLSVSTWPSLTLSST